jgi:hypothetical protein
MDILAELSAAAGCGTETEALTSAGHSCSIDARIGGCADDVGITRIQHQPVHVAAERGMGRHPTRCGGQDFGRLPALVRCGKNSKIVPGLRTAQEKN